LAKLQRTRSRSRDPNVVARAGRLAEKFLSRISRLEGGVRSKK
jgi:hypothetical protein